MNIVFGFDTALEIFFFFRYPPLAAEAPAAAPPTIKIWPLSSIELPVAVHTANILIENQNIQTMEVESGTVKLVR
jgi:hypothetical protein